MKRKQSLFFFLLFCLISFGFESSKTIWQLSRVKIKGVSKLVRTYQPFGSTLKNPSNDLPNLFASAYFPHYYYLENRISLLSNRIGPEAPIDLNAIDRVEQTSNNLMNNEATLEPNIVIRGIIGSNPTIQNGSTVASSLNNTLFAQQIINSGSQTKGFRIANEMGTSNLLISEISLSGNLEDFFITENISNPIEPNNFEDFSITFQPTSNSGVRTATVTVVSNDPDRSPYTFIVQGTANCPSLSGTISPNSGPIGTTISINLTTADFMGAVATLNEVELDLVSESIDELVVRVPTAVDLGGPLRIELSSGCTFSSIFKLTDTAISGCETDQNSPVTDLFISQITDSPAGGLTYIELYNATGNQIDFSATNYTISIFNNGNSTPFTTLILDEGILMDADTYVVSASNSSCSGPGNNGSLADEKISGQGINFNFNGNINIGHDCIRLSSLEAVDADSNPEGVVDVWGVYEDETWASGLGLGQSGANFERKVSSIIPNGVYSSSDWEIININNCEEIDYSSIGNYDFSNGEPPSIISQSSDPIFDCNLTQTLIVQASEGFNKNSDSKSLNYTWFYNEPGLEDWIEILPTNTNYIGQQTDSLTILDIEKLNGYQFYCQVMEDDETCFSSSDVIKLNVLRSLWNGSSWSEIPTADRIVVLNDNYNTGVGGSGQTYQSSFDACKLVINEGSQLTIADGNYVEVESNITVNGSLVIEPTGSLVQIDNSATTDGAVTELANRDKIAVKKRTAQMSTHREWTYWSSPVTSETIENGLHESASTRRYLFNAQNYLDATAETANNNAAIPGQDDIDDNGDDWEQILFGSTLMDIGVGYASTHNNSGFVFPNTGFVYTFNGPVNNGLIEVPIYRNDSEINDNNWNLIGNPYPSAISVDDFLDQNASSNLNNTSKPIDGAIYLWSHNTPASATANGNEPLNYSSGDYAIINGVAEIEGGDNIRPNRFIPSGQGFFVSMSNNVSPISVSGNIKSSNVVFDNSMRVKGTGNNTQFFKSSEEDLSSKLRINLTTDNGVFSQILVAYVDGATSAYDGMYFDAPRNLSTPASASIYTRIENSNKQFAIQAKSLEDLSSSEVISLGFQTSISEATVYTIAIKESKGDVLNSKTVYIRDNALDQIHDLTQSSYYFTSNIGVYDFRFDILFSNTPLVAKIMNDIPQYDLSIVELNQGRYKFSIDDNLIMRRIEVFDLFGRKFYDFKVESSSVTKNLAQLSQATYIMKIELSNGRKLWKKTLKRF